MVKARTVDKKILASKKVLKRALKKEKSKNASQDAEISKLKAAVEALKKKKTARGHVSEYNLFIRKQIRSGLTFTNAAKQWSKYKLLQSKNKRRPSAYNQFIGSQMRIGKTFKQAVALWKLAKKGKLGKKGRVVTKTVVKVKRVKSKPRVILRNVARVSRNSGPAVEKLNKLFSSSITKSNIKDAMAPDDEEIAFRILQTYFIEVARLGFKRRLTLDEIIDAYFYSLARVKLGGASVDDIAKAARESGVIE